VVKRSRVNRCLGLKKGVDMTDSDISVNELIMSALTAMALIYCFTFLYGANIEALSKPKYQAHEKNLTTEYLAEKNRCESLFASEKTFCDTNIEVAKDNSKVDLDSNFESSVQKRNMDKYVEIYRDKTLKFEDFEYKSNLFIRVKFENIYHVEA
jgi:hypothetical protein